MAEAQAAITPAPTTPAPNASQQPPAPPPVDELAPEDRKAQIAKLIEEKPAPAPKPEAKKNDPAPDVLAAAAVEARKARDLQAKLTQRMDAIEQDAARAKEVMELAARDPAAFMERFHPARDKWFNEFVGRVNNDGKPTPQEGQRELIQRIEAQEAEIKKLREERTADQHNQRANDYVAMVNRELEKPDYAIVKADPLAMKELWDYVREHAAQTGQLLPIDEALGTIAKRQEDRLTQLSGHEAFRSRFGAQPQQQIKPTPQQAAATNQQPARATPPTVDDLDEWDHEARRERAVKSLRWTPGE